MYLSGTPEDIVTKLQRDAPNLRCQDVAAQAMEIVAPYKAQLLPWQGAALYSLARPYNRCGAHVLEIGTACGYSAAVLAMACPNASITTLNPTLAEVAIASRNLERFGNVTLLRMRSWDYLDIYHGPRFDMIWVDGDHKRAIQDVPWWSWLRPWGLQIWHDYSVDACPSVFGVVNQFGERLGRRPDVVVMDDRNIGMAGFYRRDGDDGALGVMA